MNRITCEESRRPFPACQELILLTPGELMKLREAVMERDGNLDRFKEWQQGRFIKLEYSRGEATLQAYKPQKFNPWSS